MPLIDNDEIDRSTEAYQKAEQFFLGHMKYEAIPNGIVSQMAIPEIGAAAFGLMDAVMNEKSLVPAELKMLIAHMTSYAAGCTYCQTATFQGAQAQSASSEKFEKIWEYQTSDLFSDGERAALDIALAAKASPSDVTEELRNNLKKHYGQTECAEILGMIALFAFYQTWNDTNGTRLDEQVKGFVENHLRGSGHLNEDKFKELAS